MPQFSGEGKSNPTMCPEEKKDTGLTGSHGDSDSTFLSSLLLLSQIMPHPAQCELHGTEILVTAVSLAPGQVPGTQ
jgi:hypothetical protein